MMCPECDRSFNPKALNAKFCSKTCKLKNIYRYRRNRTILIKELSRRYMSAIEISRLKSCYNLTDKEVSRIRHLRSKYALSSL